MFYFLKHPPRLVTGVFSSLTWTIPTNKKELFLTFDDGPTPAITIQVLKILEEYNAHATFFCLGKNVENYPDIYSEIIKKGHATGNHTFNHLNGWKTSNEIYYKDIFKAHELIPCSLFRPPYGRIRLSQINYLKKIYKIILWDIISEDFNEIKTPEDCTKFILRHVKPGSVLVYHDSIKASNNVLNSLPLVLEKLTNKGYEFSSII